jgi:[ribosomal protein S5]-alanine N-acetyltransferase
MGIGLKQMAQIIPRSFTIETKRCLLREPSAADIPHIFSATRFSGFNDGMHWEPPNDIEELSEPLQRNLMAWDAGIAFTFTIVMRSSKEFLGRIVIRQGHHPRIWELGFWTHPIHQNQGFMTEAARAILDFGFNKLAAAQIEACHATWNKGSQKVLENIGMKFVQYIPEGFQKQGQWIAGNLMNISKEEWCHHK